MKYIFITLLLLLTVNLAKAQSTETYIVTSKTLNMRSGAGTQFDKVTSLALGDTVSIIEKTNSEWWYAEYDGYQGYVFAQYLKVDPYSGWEKKNYQSGSSPECENVNPVHDYDLDNYLRIKVGSANDVVVKLMKLNPYGEDECIRIVYVRSNDVYEIKNIPEGKYYLKIAYGKDYRQKIVNNQCEVKFLKNPLYEKGKDILDYYKVKKPNKIVGNQEYESWSVPSFELSLDVVISNSGSSTFKANNISEEEFNK